MKEIFRIALSLITSAAVPATIFSIPYFLDRLQVYSQKDMLNYAYSSTLSVWFISLIVSLMHSVLLGLPIYCVVKRFNLINWWTAILCGFLIGCLPTAFISFPHPSPGEGYTFDGVILVLNGVTTYAGWLSYIKTILVSGCLGMTGGFSAWIVWKIMKQT